MELSGFMRSKVIIVLWVGLPLIAILLRLLQPDTDELTLLMFVAIIVSGIGGTLSAVLLGTTITNERIHGVYDLFLIRPVTRKDLLLGKFFAGISAVLAAVLLSVVLGIAVVWAFILSQNVIG